jgi:hypothetical protein
MSSKGPEIHGKQQMHDLARDTFVTLRAAGFGDVVDMLRSRVLVRPSHDLMDTVQTGEYCQWSFKPMVELLLLHARDVATREPASPAQQRRDMLEALDLSGF